MKPYLLAAAVALVTFSAGSVNAETITLRAGHSANADEPYHKGLERFAQVLETETEGRVKVEIFPNNQLGNEKEMIEGVMLGTLDITVPTNGVLTNFVDELSIFDLPFLFKSRQHMYGVLEGEVGASLSNSMQDKGFKLLGFYEAGVRHIITKAPIYSIDDLDGDKVRTMQIPAHVASFNAFGANATPIAYSELYSALQSGVVDGAEAAYTNYESKRFYEVAPYLAEVSWTTLVADLIMSEEKFESFPEDIQVAILKAGKASTDYEREVYANSDSQLRGKLESYGVTITKPDVAPFRERAQKVYDEFADTDKKKKLVELIEKTE
ncbi:TRAP transporter substrate-binding protein [Marinobacterium rhizophilum]|uniref:TRAP transporter substrate-binding protein n=1 Tax=Marinobacterium rhizophilum TaxID=420402 RepID=UPI00036D4C3C|nr:TRAP transporter substrate-binding protein [Marinobacterium rhizophilum]